WPFLCAIALSPVRSGSVDRGDLHGGLVLAMTHAAPVVLAALLLVDEDPRPAVLGDDDAAHGCAVDQGCAHLDLVAVAAKEDLRELDFLARLAGQFLNGQAQPGADAVLLAAGSDHRIRHGLFPSKAGDPYRSRASCQSAPHAPCPDRSEGAAQWRIAEANA